MSNHPEERQRWSLAHGYLHFLAHRQKSEFHFDGQYQRIPESERLAETFPKYFLMPTSGLLKRSDMVPLHYQHLAIEALDQGIITEGRFADFLNVDRLEARRIASALRPYSSGMMEEDTDFDLRQIQE